MNATEITPVTRYTVMIDAARRVPQPLLDAAATLLPREPDALVAHPDVTRWLDDAYAVLPLEAQHVRRIDLTSFLKDRLCVHLAAEAARVNASTARILELLWPSDRRSDPRSAVASSAEAAAL